ncbi:MAG: lycopene cyclase domain-containing protein [Chloroflexota bacterium]
MKYFGFLARFVVVPLIILRLILWWDREKGRDLPDHLQNWPEDKVLLAHAAVAVSYTTAWDNYLVASDVWSYDRDLVTGVTIGWVPIEEYTFFVLQTLLTGSWLQVLARRIPASDTPYETTHAGARVLATGALGALWLGALRSMISGDPGRTYRDLIVVWAIPPIALQVAFGGDILWRHRRLVAASILSSTAYLGVSDSLAIDSGTWAINPEKTIKREVIRNLPFEEALFFFLTNVMLTFGVTLVQAKESESRLPKFLRGRYDRFKQQWLENNT